MNKRFRDINNNKIKELANSQDLFLFLDGVHYFIKQYSQGKVFFNQDKIKRFQEIAANFLGKSITFYHNEMVQTYVAQYNDFNLILSKNFPDLFQKEIEVSQQNIFNKKEMAHPMENVKKTVLFYNESTGSELMSRAGQLGRDLLEIGSRAENSRVSDTEETNILEASVQFLKKKDTSILDLLQSLIKNVENYPDKEIFSENINHMGLLIQLKNSSLERLENNPVEYVNKFLTGISDTQSHIEYFCSYFHRLVHIKKYGNREYGEEYYDFRSKQFNEKKFFDMCKTELNDFPDLQNFFKRYCNTFKKLRNIRSHQVAGEVKVFHNGFISIPNINNKKGKRFDYREKREKMITYGVFINKIKLHTYSPYNESEDIFVTLE
ncbi:hypothetical protein LCGC14_0457220 [marine sediment metagenome]|uniref:Uncharacterized protein n=1 Tax=marine sediment metagenome TaxID=412755 RepID=A0A0F9SZ25_9ZZZZ